MAFTGAIGALIVLAVVPEAIWLYVIAAASYILHSAALIVKNVREGDYDPGQMTFSSPVHLLAVVFVVGVFESTILLVATGLAYGLHVVLAAPMLLVLAVAVYYPVADLAALRRGIYTPGILAMIATVLVIDTVITLRQAVLESPPVVGKRRRPQS